MKFQIYKDSAGQWRWRLRAANGEIIAISSESYVQKADCQHGVKLVKSCGDARVEESL